MGSNASTDITDAESVDGNFCHTEFIVENCSISWLIENFSFSKSGTSLQTDVFISENGKGETKWLLRACPVAAKDKTTNFQLYLVLLWKKDERLFGKYTLTVRNSTKVLYEKQLKEEYFSTSKNMLIFESKDISSSLWNNNDDKVLLRVDVSVSVATVLSRILRAKEENSAVEMCEKLHSIQQEGMFSDLIIIVGEKKILAHRLILSAASPVFHEMLTRDSFDTRQKRVAIFDFDFETVKELVNYIYSKKVPNFKSFEHATLLEILKAAEKYKVCDLAQLVVHYLSFTLNDDNVIDVLLVADECDIFELKKKAIRFLKSNKTTLSALPNYEKMKSKPNLLMEIIESMK